MVVTLVRHTKPRVRPGTCYGRTDLDVAENFIDDASMIADALPPAERVISSPLTRCRKLAELICERRGAPLEIDPRVQEMDFGAWEGKLWRDIPRAELDAWAADFLNAAPHGGESVSQLRTRTISALSELRRSAASVLVVTHAGVIKAAMATGDAAEYFNVQVDFGAAVTLPPNEETRHD